MTHGYCVTFIWLTGRVKITQTINKNFSGSIQWPQLFRPVYVHHFLRRLDCLLIWFFPPPAPTWLKSHLHGNWDSTCRWDSLTWWLNFGKIEGRRRTQSLGTVWRWKYVLFMILPFFHFYLCLIEDGVSQKGREESCWLLIKAAIKPEPLYS